MKILFSVCVSPQIHVNFFMTDLIINMDGRLNEKWKRELMGRKVRN